MNCPQCGRYALTITGNCGLCGYSPHPPAAGVVSFTPPLCPACPTRDAENARLREAATLAHAAIAAHFDPHGDEKAARKALVGAKMSLRAALGEEG